MEKERRFIPLNGNVLLRKADINKQIKKGNFIVAETTAEKTIPEGVVVSADFDKVKEKDLVVFRPQGTYEFVLNGEVYLITNSNNILGIIE